MAGMTRHRSTRVRPRYGRLALAVASTTVTTVAVLGGIGVWPSASAGDRAAQRLSATERPEPDEPAVVGTVAAGSTSAAAAPDAAVPEETAAPAEDTALPAASGEGRRVVFSEGRQRVWLVEADGTVARTYPVSGSVYDNLDPGEYAVYSRSERAWGIDDSGTMRWFVRFATGDNAAIGFHDIPVDDGARVQTVAQLGTPLSHGCIRQRTRDARRLWDFAPVGTTVVVTA